MDYNGRSESSPPARRVPVYDVHHHGGSVFDRAGAAPEQALQERCRICQELREVPERQQYAQADAYGLQKALRVTLPPYRGLLPLANISAADLRIESSVDPSAVSGASHWPLCLLDNNPYRCNQYLWKGLAQLCNAAQIPRGRLIESLASHCELFDAGSTCSEVRMLSSSSVKTHLASESQYSRVLFRDELMGEFVRRLRAWRSPAKTAEFTLSDVCFAFDVWYEAMCLIAEGWPMMPKEAFETKFVSKISNNLLAQH